MVLTQLKKRVMERSVAVIGDDVHILQLPDVDKGFFGKGMRLGNHHLHFVCDDGIDIHFRLALHRKHYQTQIGAAIEDGGCGGPGFPLLNGDLDVRILLLILGDQLGEVHVQQNTGADDTHFTHFGGLNVLNAPVNILILFHQPASVLIEHLAGIRQRKGSAAADDQRRTQFFLQIADAAAEDRLGHVQLLRSPGKTFGFRHGQKVFDVLNIHSKQLLSLLKYSKKAWIVNKICICIIISVRIR